jgi:Ner family transcriptional regulator
MFKHVTLHASATKHGAKTMQQANAKKAGLKDWHPADIVAALRKNGYTLSKLAFEHGLKDSSGLSVAMVRSFPKGEQRIANALGKEPREIWPSRFNEDGTRKLGESRALHVTREMRERKAGTDLRQAA